MTMTISQETITKQMQYHPEVQPFFHEATNSFSYVVTDPATNMCAVVDSILDFDLPSGSIGYTFADAILDYIAEKKLTVEWILETHMHADHLSAAMYIKGKVGGKVAIGNHITDVQALYQDVFGVNEAELREAREAFDKLWADEDTFMLGSIPAFTIYTPGHTPADILYGIGDALFVGDSLFQPDFGSARCDFPSGDAASLYESVQIIYSFADDMRMFMCHDYLPESGRSDYKAETTVGEQKAHNIHLREGVEKEDFVQKREARDATLSLPKLMIPSLQVNVRAGSIPEVDGKPMLQLPINSVFSQYPKA